MKSPLPSLRFLFCSAIPPNYCGCSLHPGFLGRLRRLVTASQKQSGSRSTRPGGTRGSGSGTLGGIRLLNSVTRRRSGREGLGPTSPAACGCGCALSRRHPGSAALSSRHVSLGFPSRLRSPWVPTAAPRTRPRASWAARPFALHPYRYCCCCCCSCSGPSDCGAPSSPSSCRTTPSSVSTKRWSRAWSSLWITRCGRSRLSSPGH